VSDLPERAEALPAADYHCRQAVDHLVAGDPGHELAVVHGIARLLEAAGGPDVGNAVRAHLEQVGRPPGLYAHGGPRERVLTSALLLHRATDDGLRGALAAAGLHGSDLRGGTPTAGAERPAVAEPSAAAEGPLVAEPIGPDAVGVDARDHHPATARQAERVSFVTRVLADRRAAVEAVLAALQEEPRSGS